MRKYQEGGQLSDTQQQGLQYLAQMYAQQTGKDPQQDQEGFMQFVQQLAQQAGVQDIGQLLDMVYQQASQQAQSARRGAKLNYLKSLTGKCPEGQELVYFKAGGKVCSKCMAKKQDGDTIEEAKCGKKMSKKKACGGIKINKGQLGFLIPYVYKHNKNFKNFVNNTLPIRNIVNSINYPEDPNFRQVGSNNLGDGRVETDWMNDKTGEKQTRTLYSTVPGIGRDIFGVSPKRKQNPVINSKRNGGSLNRIPFNRKGTDPVNYPGNIERSPKFNEPIRVNQHIK